MCRVAYQRRDAEKKDTVYNGHIHYSFDNSILLF